MYFQSIINNNIFFRFYAFADDRYTNGNLMYSDGRLFIYYFGYACGISITLTIIAMIMNYSGWVDKSWSPQLGNEMCFIKGTIHILHIPASLNFNSVKHLFIFFNRFSLSYFRTIRKRIVFFWTIGHNTRH